ncbi:siphovirus ReqiPepy6 Gp37-like family protein [Mesobacillus jeotgali]|uniref:siphovirus ReqiPepy6 Gp37-like family protein n=1 Tax=Mesobacillus jeotgali TaxID=129985 RepID=UPI001CFD190F|nr:siphovirus ReqiPepy6 Gp37-like family protein [Mesobacillus jeotgali]
MKPIRIITPGFELRGEIDDYTSMWFTSSWHGIGQLELRINRYKKHVEHLVKNNLIMVNAQKVYIIKHREIELDENGKATENWVIKALQLKIITGQRITVPPTTTAYDNKQGNAETVMKHYVIRNLTNAPDPKRNIDLLSIAQQMNRGPSVSWQSRFKNLAEELADISLNSGIGWDVTLDIQNKKWLFDVYVGRDLTAGQSLLPPVIFSPQFDSLQSLHYSESELNYKNAAYVGGQGEGIDRRIIELGSETGLTRHEVFIDARDVEEKDENDQPLPEAQIISTLTERGQQKLQEFLQEEYLEGQILTKSPFTYEEDYDLGDIATIQNKSWGVTMDARLTEVKEIYETSGFKLEATFGNDRPTLIKKIKQELSQISGEVRK